MDKCRAFWRAKLERHTCICDKPILGICVALWWKRRGILERCDISSCLQFARPGQWAVWSGTQFWGHARSTPSEALRTFLPRQGRNTAMFFLELSAIQGSINFSANIVVSANLLALRADLRAWVMVTTLFSYTVPFNVMWLITRKLKRTFVNYHLATVLFHMNPLK